MHSRSLGRVFAVTLAALASTTGSARAFVPPNFQTVTRVSWTGHWSTTYGPMQLVQVGGLVSGSYTYSSPAVIGHVSGSVEGTTLRVRWVEGPGGAGVGDAWFILSSDARSFVGSWVKEGDSSPPNPWTGFRVP